MDLRLVQNSHTTTFLRMSLVFRCSDIELPFLINFMTMVELNGYPYYDKFNSFITSIEQSGTTNVKIPFEIINHINLYLSSYCTNDIDVDGEILNLNFLNRPFSFWVESKNISLFKNTVVMINLHGKKYWEEYNKIMSDIFPFEFTDHIDLYLDLYEREKNLDDILDE